MYCRCSQARVCFFFSLLRNKFGWVWSRGKRRAWERSGASLSGLPRPAGRPRGWGHGTVLGGACSHPEPVGDPWLDHPVGCQGRCWHGPGLPAATLILQPWPKVWLVWWPRSSAVQEIPLPSLFSFPSKKNQRLGCAVLALFLF